MSKYIDAEWLKELYKPYASFNGKEYSVPIGAILANIDDAPSIDIVRCRECKHAHMTYGGECKYCDVWKDDDDTCLELYLDGDFYCADGEREGE